MKLDAILYVLIFTSQDKWCGGWVTLLISGASLARPPPYGPAAGSRRIAAAVHYFRRMVCLRFMVRQALFATDEIDDELPSFEFNNRNWQHRMFLMRQTLLDLNHLCDREIQRAQQHLQTFVTTDYQNQWY